MDKKTTLIFAPRAREEVRKNICPENGENSAVYYMRLKCRRRPAVFLPQQ
jgi:hypothetical protein